MKANTNQGKGKYQTPNAINLLNILCFSPRQFSRWVQAYITASLLRRSPPGIWLGENALAPGLVWEAAASRLSNFQEVAANTSEGTPKGSRASRALGRKSDVDLRQQCRKDLTHYQGMFMS